MAFGMIIKSIREQLGITQEQLAQELNVSFPQLIGGKMDIEFPKG